MRSRLSRGGKRRLDALGMAVTALGCLVHCSADRQVLWSSPEAVGGSDLQGPSATGGYSPGVGGGPAVGGSADAGGSCAAGPGGGSGGAGGTTMPGSGGAAGASGGCDFGFVLVARVHAGVPRCECAPPSDCTSDLDCPTGWRCFAGQACDDGCSTPSCCSGNQCAPASCPELAGLPCPAVGCPDGEVCMASCSSVSCTCDQAAWACTFDGGAQTSCDAACAVP